MSASQASFASRPGNDRERLRSYAMVAFMHILQPLARLKGRIGHGLTPWRRRGTPEGVFPIPQQRSVWTETWRDPNEVISAIFGSLVDDGAIVRSGGDFDRWDLEVR